MALKPILLNNFKNDNETTRAIFLKENSDPSKKEFSFKRFKTEKERIVRKYVIICSLISWIFFKIYIFFPLYRMN